MKKTLSIILFVLLFIPTLIFAQDPYYGYPDEQEQESNSRDYLPVSDGDMISDKGGFCPGVGGEDDGAIDLSTDTYIPAPGSYDSDGEASSEGR